MIICGKCGNRNFFKPGDELICECKENLDNRKKIGRNPPPSIKQNRCLHDETPDEESGDYSLFYSYPYDQNNT